MLHDLANDGDFVAVKRAAEDRQGWRHRERMSKTCCRASDYWTGEQVYGIWYLPFSALILLLGIWRWL